MTIGALQSGGRVLILLDHELGVEGGGLHGIMTDLGEGSELRK